MATSGRINGTAMNGGAASSIYAFWIDWTRNGYSIENNTSNITVHLRIQRTDGYANGAWALDVRPSVSLSVGGAAKTPSISFIDTRNSVICTFATWTGDVKHNPDGSLNCPISASFTHYGSSSLDGGTLSGSANLDTIPQATSFDYLSCATSFFTGTMTFRYTPKASTLYNRCNITLVLSGNNIAVKTINLGQKPASQQTATVTLSSDELATIYNRLPSSTKGTLRFTFLTYSDSGYSKQVGSAPTKELTLNIPDDTSTKPTVNMELSPVSSLPSAFSGLYIQGKTKVKASTLSATPKYNASITSTTMTVEGASYGSGSSYTSGYLTQYGSVPVYGSAKDGRGFTGSASKNINVIAYSKPKIQNVVAARCDSNGNLSDSGTSLKISATCNYEPVISGGVQKNFCSIRYRVKASGDEYDDNSWKPLLDRTAAGNTVTSGPLLDGALDTKTTYLVQVQAIDDIGEHAETEVGIPTEEVYMHRTKNAMGLGKYAEGENVLDVAWDAHFRGDVFIGDAGMTLREYILSIIKGG